MTASEHRKWLKSNRDTDVLGYRLFVAFTFPPPDRTTTNPQCPWLENRVPW
jgi:hypothetical protein